MYECVLPEQYLDRNIMYSFCFLAYLFVSLFIYCPLDRFSYSLDWPQSCLILGVLVILLYLPSIGITVTYQNVQHYIENLLAGPNERKTMKHSHMLPFLCFDVLVLFPLYLRLFEDRIMLSISYMSLYSFYCIMPGCSIFSVDGFLSWLFSTSQLSH